MVSLALRIYSAWHIVTTLSQSDDAQWRLAWLKIIASPCAWAASIAETVAPNGHRKHHTNLPTSIPRNTYDDATYIFAEDNNIYFEMLSIIFF